MTDQSIVERETFPLSKERKLEHLILEGYKVTPEKQTPELNMGAKTLQMVRLVMGIYDAWLARPSDASAKLDDYRAIKSLITNLDKITRTTYSHTAINQVFENEVDDDYEPIIKVAQDFLTQDDVDYLLNKKPQPMVLDEFTNDSMPLIYQVVRHDFGNPLSPLASSSSTKTYYNNKLAELKDKIDQSTTTDQREALLVQFDTMQKKAEEKVKKAAEQVVIPLKDLRHALDRESKKITNPFPMDQIPKNQLEVYLTNACSEISDKTKIIFEEDNYSEKEILGSELWLDTIIKNMIGNAEKAWQEKMRNGSRQDEPPCFSINVYLDPAKNCYTVVATDNGIGFDKQRLDDQFMTVDSENEGKNSGWITEELKGKGIGMSLCAKVLREKYHANIRLVNVVSGHETMEEVTGIPNSGARIYMEFPILKKEGSNQTQSSTVDQLATQ